MRHKLHLYFGDGKGKTTAAMGLALRALGHGRRVLIAQFIKNGKSGELEALRHLPGALIADMPSVEKFTFQMSETELAQTKANQSEALGKLIDLIAAERPEMIILDELAVAAHIGLIGEDDMFRLIDAGLRYGDTVVTGRNAPDSLLERADYATEMVSRRHPFDIGLTARKGIEW